jgi:hypothetical protein
MIFLRFSYSVFLYIEVIPLGVCSWNTRNEFKYFRRVAINFSPDVLILVICQNDLKPNRGGRTEISENLLTIMPLALRK